jgi:hypothetical protein
MFRVTISRTAEFSAFISIVEMASDGRNLT